MQKQCATRTLCCRTCQRENTKRENTFAINVLHVATCTLVGNTHEPRAPKTFCAEVQFFLKVNELHLQGSILVVGAFQIIAVVFVSVPVGLHTNREPQQHHVATHGSH